MMTAMNAAQWTLLATLVVLVAIAMMVSIAMFADDGDDDERPSWVGDDGMIDAHEMLLAIDPFYPEIDAARRDSAGPVKAPRHKLAPASHLLTANDIISMSYEEYRQWLRSPEWPEGSTYMTVQDRIGTKYRVRTLGRGAS
jgi:hypothetical protein